MRRNRIRLSESQLHRVIKESVKRVLREIDEDNETYQVNIFKSVDGDVHAYVTRYSKDGYQGTTRGTTYADGWDETTWCVFVGTKQECEDYAFKFNSQQHN